MKNNYSPLVSIVIPVYNGENYLREAIDSALAQTYSKVEIIVVNDGSIDHTEEIALSYGNKIRYFSKPNGGTSSALNIGIANMKGDYFSWLSHDDLYYPNKIEAQIDELNKIQDKNTILMSDLDAINTKYEKVYKTDYIARVNAHPPRLQSPIYPIIYMQLHGCTLLIPRVCFNEVGLFDETCLVAQDFEFFYRAFLKFPYKYISKVLVTARDSSNRQGIRSKVRGSFEYSKLFTSIIATLSEEDIKLLAPSTLRFYQDMENMFKSFEYIEAYEYIRKKMMCNVQINYSDTIGGKFNGYEMHLKMRKRGFDSYQLVYRRDSDDDSTYYWSDPSYQAVLYPVIEKVENQHNIRSLFSPFPYDILANKLFLDAEIVHYHIIHHPAFNLNMLPLMTRLKPSVWSLHDPWALTGHCVHPYECRKYETGCGECPQLDSPYAISSDNSALSFSIKKDIIQRCNVSIIVATSWMKEKVENSPITKGLPVYLVPFGLDLNVFNQKDKKSAKRNLGIDEESFVIMFRSTNDVFKGCDMVKDALRSLKVPKKATLITVDSKGLVQELSGKYNVLEYGWISNDNFLADLYNASDIFLMPSRAEAFGLMAAEAMCCGTMVLGIEGTALPGVINAPYCGIATEGDSIAFSKELQRLLDKPDEVASRGIRSYEFAKANYDLEKYIDRIIFIYQEVIKNHKISKEDEILLKQLKKHMSNEPIKTNIYKNLGRIEAKSRRMMSKAFKLPMTVRVKRLSIKMIRIIKRKMPPRLKNVIKKAILSLK
jgi:glycosyltransferase involved in cell wall biosynthesis